jgi:hypothetical protein
MQHIPQMVRQHHLRSPSEPKARFFNVAAVTSTRNDELAAVRFRDFDLGQRRVHGKGGKIRKTPIPTEELREDIAALSLRRDPMEHLPYPQRRGPGGRLLWDAYCGMVSCWESGGGGN